MAAMKSTEQREWKERFALLMNKMQGRWPVEESRLQGILATYMIVAGEVGYERFAIAVDQIVLNSGFDFFPSVPEFRGWVPESKMRVIPGQRWYRDPHCACQGTGFEDAGIDREGNHQVRRCGNPDCLRVSA